MAPVRHHNRRTDETQGQTAISTDDPRARKPGNPDLAPDRNEPHAAGDPAAQTAGGRKHAVPKTLLSRPQGRAAGDQHKPPADGRVQKREAEIPARPQPGQSAPTAPKPEDRLSPRRRTAQTMAGDVPGQSRGKVRNQKPAPTGAAMPAPETARPAKEDDGSGNLFLRMAAFLFVFLIGFLAGLGYEPLMRYIQEGPLVADKGVIETATPSEPEIAAEVSETPSESGLQPRDVQPVTVPSQGDQLTAMADPSAGEPVPSADQQAMNLAEPSPEEASTAGRVETLQGTLTGVDDFLIGSGQVRIIQAADGKDMLRISELSVQDLPDLQIAIVAANAADGDFDFLGADQVALGAVRTAPGDQDYQIPEGINVAEFPTVIIWSRPFGLLVAKASLE